MAQLRVVELEQEVLALRAELDTVTAAWHAAENVRRTPEAACRSSNSPLRRLPWCVDATQDDS